MSNLADFFSLLSSQAPPVALSSHFDSSVILTLFFCQAIKEWGVPSFGVTQCSLVYAGFRLSAAGYVSGIFMIVAVLAGFTVGVLSLYLVSRSGGRWAAERLLGRLHQKQTKLDDWQRRISSAGWMVVIGRFIPSLMAPLTVMAGVVRLPLRVYYTGTALAMLAWTAFFASLGFFFGDAALKIIGPALSRAGAIIIPLCVLALVVFYLARRQWLSKRTAPGV